MGIVKNKGFKTGLKGHFAKLKADLAPMTFKEKVDHIWTYYKEYMLVAFCVLFIVVGALVSILTPKKELLLAGMQCNVKLSTEGYDYLTKDFQADVLGETEGQTLLHSQQFYGEVTVEAVDHTYQAEQSVTAYVEAKKLDYMLMDVQAFKYFIDDRIYMDLRELLPQEDLDWLAEQEMLIYAQSEENSELIPRAIDISGTAFCQQEYGEAECLLVFIRNTPRTENCKKLWEHIKNYQ